MIKLEKITWDNWEECMNLEVTEEQDDFVASNTYSLSQSYVALLNDEYPPLTYAIYNDDVMVGFTMFGYDTAGASEYGDEACYSICRFMIDKRYQKKGFGRQAMAKILEYIRSFPQGDATVVYIAYNPKNEVARKLYASFGFAETEKIVYDETVARLDL